MRFLKHIPQKLSEFGHSHTITDFFRPVLAFQMGDLSFEDSPIQAVDQMADQAPNHQDRRRRSVRLRRRALAHEAEPNRQESPASDTLTLSLVLQDQGRGDLKHWLLYVARENQPGLCYQVVGIPPLMQYWAPDKPVDIKATRSCWNMFELGTVTAAQAAMVEEIASQEPPALALDLDAGAESCQGWTVRVLGKLYDRGVVDATSMSFVRSMLEPA
ncbi:hypothetical protein P170DRAFT_436366 [Aspergillus steynii IBT 23096]|uniref:Uncharacterized protein n=1 Tax=Aspergillus steynii IBT 23096 TaxID=1392250 RepID=A0A2I2GEQ5_9EURO|nr:uncharacterized protein P170DRAFT_436366 [Aspergillus steynii IBT 23096]PLB51331.1 hypothetical protein P170DRAFT_436366 [Aspergillus steynii IBT 23096]